MEKYLFDHLSFTRNLTLMAVKDIDDVNAAIIPTGFNNNICWNLGHIYSAQEQFAFHFSQEPMVLPDGFREFFGKDTRPADWTKEPPKLEEMLELLKEQPKRIRKTLENRLNDEVLTPLVLPGITLKTVKEFLSFSLYHEGIHVQAIRIIQRLNQNNH